MTTQSTLWSDVSGSTTIHPHDKIAYTMPDNRTRRPEQSATIATHAAKSPGGFMPNDDGSARPATSLGFADTQARTRPDFDAVMGLEKPPRPEPASESEFVAVRREIYRKGVSLRRAFGRIGPGSRLRTERFREILGGLQLGVPPESVDRIVASLTKAARRELFAEDD